MIMFHSGNYDVMSPQSDLESLNSPLVNKSSFALHSHLRNCDFVRDFILPVAYFCKLDFSYCFMICSHSQPYLSKGALYLGKVTPTVMCLAQEGGVLHLVL